MRKTITLLLLTFVVFTAGYAVGKEIGARRALAHVADQQGSEAPRSARSHQLRIRYFHSTKRCSTCNTLEAYARETIESEFAAALTSGALVFELANMDEAWNQPDVEEYGLVRSSLVLSDRRAGQEEDYRVLHRLWDLTDDEAGFRTHLREAVQRVFDGWATTPAEDER